MQELSPFQKHLQRAKDALSLHGPLAHNPDARLLHNLVLILAVWFSFWSALLLPFYPGAVAKLPGVVLETATPIASLVLLRLGFFRQASAVYLAGTWAFATLVVARDGGIRSPVQIMYGTLPVIASWLLGYRAALWTAAACILSSLAFAVIDVAGLSLRREFSSTPFGIWAILLQAILTGGVPVAQVVRRLQETLAESRRTQQELRGYKEDLELLVQDRTADLVEARDEALAANRAKGVFLANMSHDLRTPLNAILGFARLTREAEDLPEHHREKVEIIERSGEHLLDLINDLLDLAKVEAGKLTLEEAPADLTDLLSEVAELMRVRAEEKGLKLYVDQSEAFPRHALIDAVKLRRILTNLLANAIQYTERGQVTLHADAEMEPTLLLKFVVADTGVGIGFEDQERIFAPFVRAGTPGADGSGLGLAITRDYVRLMNGTIGLESAPGRGSRFQIAVPAKTAAPGVLSRSKGEARRVIGLAAGQPVYRVLIVEDQKENRILLHHLLSGVGFDVRAVEDGAAAVETFGSWRPHFIWMDWRMPVMDGEGATQRIREMEGGREVKITAITASLFPNDYRAIMAAGVDEVVRKPFRTEDVLDCMARSLGVRYVHAHDTTDSERTETEIIPQRLSMLPEQLRVELTNAVISLDVARMVKIVGRVAELDADLGSALAAYVDRFAFTRILTAIQDCAGDESKRST
jgi:signal transduction histidine kinase/CheY-like chemotaxis protein